MTIERETATSDRPQATTYRQYAIPLGVTLGLVIAAVLCLGYAWLHRTPAQPLVEDQTAITSMLLRTSVVVGAAVVLALLILVVGRGRRQSSTWRARVVERLWPALAVLGVIGIVVLHRGETRGVFARAVDAQVALQPFAVATVARWAWWCACLAVLTLAVVAMLSHVDPGARRPSPLFISRALAAAVAVAVVTVVAVGVLAARGDEPVLSQTAERIDAPPAPTEVTGDVAYKVEFARGQGKNVAAGGAGFVRWAAAYGGPGGSPVEGFDGRTGQRRWVFQAPEVDVSTVATTGTGPDSVAVLQARGALIALDATTGAPLWVRHDAALLDDKHPQRGVNTQAILVERRVPGPPGSTAAGFGTQWDALSPRTGDVLWTETFPYQCYPTARAADSAILVRSCHTPPEVAAELLDPSTGNPRGAVSAEALNIQPDEVAAARGDVEIGAVKGDSAVITVNRYGPGDSTTFAVDAATGAVKNTAPNRHSAALLDVDTLLVAPYPAVRRTPVPLSVMDLATGALTPTGSFWSSAADEDGLFALFAQVGPGWLTFAPDDPAVVAAMADPAHSEAPPLRSIDASGTTRTYRYPCDSDMRGIPWVAVIPGAVLVECADGLVAMR